MKLDEGIGSAAHLRQLDGDRRLSFVQHQTIKHLVPVYGILLNDG
jgi:hypothetical protein